MFWGGTRTIGPKLRQDEVQMGEQCAEQSEHRDRGVTEHEIAG